MNNFHPALQRYFPIADMIAQTFGHSCEVVIHDLSIPQNSVVYAANGHVTGRQVGQSFEHLVREVLLSKNFSHDVTANYMTTTPDGRRIKSSTSLLRNEDGKVIGALCINYDLEAFAAMKLFLDDFLGDEPTAVQPIAEPFDNVTAIVDELIDKIIGGADPDTLKRKEKIDLISFMDKKGIFLMKGALEKVADKLNISKVTVYSYLDELKKS